MSKKLAVEMPTAIEKAASGAGRGEAKARHLAETAVGQMHLSESIVRGYLPELAGKTDEEKRAFAHQMRARIAAERREADKGLRNAKAKKRALKNKLANVKMLADMCPDGNVQLMPGRQCFEEFLAALRERHVFAADKDEAVRLAYKSICNAHCFVFSQSYASLLKDTDADQGEFRLPYPWCAWQFRFGNEDEATDMIAITLQKEMEMYISVAFKGIDTWVTLTPDAMPFDRYAAEERKSTSVGPWVCDEIRAASIMLEAEIAIEDVVRIPHRSNVARQREGKTPLLSYSTIDLRHRKRYEGVGDNPQGTRRLHFRRGHWRHYATHKVWIKWQVVGDPTKGVVLSDYRL